jgi:hypothetical protein
MGLNFKRLIKVLSSMCHRLIVAIAIKVLLGYLRKRFGLGLVISRSLLVPLGSCDWGSWVAWFGAFISPQCLFWLFPPSFWMREEKKLTVSLQASFILMHVRRQESTCWKFCWGHAEAMVSPVTAREKHYYYELRKMEVNPIRRAWSSQNARWRTGQGDQRGVNGSQ